MKTLLFALVFALSLGAFGQQDSTITSIPSDSLVVKREHSVRKATIMSAIVPGLGQAYNQKYWKVPIVLAGVGISIYFIDQNTKDFKFYRSNLIAELDDDPNTLNTSGLTSSDLDFFMNDSRRLLDLSYIALAAVYALNIIDANVDAHLFHFDVGEDIAMSIRPSLIPSRQFQTGLSLTLNF